MIGHFSNIEVHFTFCTLNFSLYFFHFLLNITFLFSIIFKPGEGG